MEKMKDLNEIKHKLIDWVKTETVKGFESPAEVEILGEVVDMIKDLASAEESCMEAAYYENVTEAMENYEADGGEGRMGYDRWRYSSGRFAPKGRGTYGYTPTPSTVMPVTMEPMGYDGRMNGNTVATGNMTRTGTRTRMGYNAAMGHTENMEPKERLDEAIDIMGDIWSSADSSTKTKMKSMVRDLLDQMEHSA